MNSTRFPILSINIGKPQTYEFEGGKVETGIVKRPAESAVMLYRENFAGDGQADLVNHGGRDKAVCVYPSEHYPYWENALARRLPEAAFGENLTVKGLTERDVWIGDVYQLDEAVVQVSQPRQPCVKLAKKYGVKDMVLQVQKTGYTGFYFRVLEEGNVSPGAELELLSRGAQKISISYANQVKYHDAKNLTAIKAILREDTLSESWRTSFIKKRDRLLQA
ncbi:MOSC domain-containing protein [Bacillus atrophaeus]|uniref:MOSC domain-containing protein n=1 Tax=Bacillus atrophaeus TaxID=1452 RepID=UPI0007C59A2A|nr:MOSC domain-containing protein [Bacillus atrophaeus]MBU5262382.1 MOSC domain-containing protein [Bacillus atrophaeus]WFE14944.1 MOSC domain-containing protein [Bacillus atrophaeus]